MGVNFLEQHVVPWNCRGNHFLYSTADKLVLKFKIRISDCVIKNFVGLDAKVFSIIYEYNTKCASEVSTVLLKRAWHLKCTKILRVNQVTCGIVSKRALKYGLETIQNIIFSFSAFNGKGIILQDTRGCLRFRRLDAYDASVSRSIIETHGCGEYSQPKKEKLTNNFFCFATDFVKIYKQF